MRKITVLLILACFLVSGCSAGSIFGPTPTTTPTITPTITLTSTLTLTPTPKPSETPTSTPSPTPIASIGNGLKTQEVMDAFKNLFKFSASTDADGNAIQTGTAEKEFSIMTITGDPDVTKAELKIDLSQEDSFIATAYWVLFLEIISRGGKEAADWVHDNFKEAMNGKVEKVFGTAKITLESTPNGKLLLLTVSPADGE